MSKNKNPTECLRSTSGRLFLLTTVQFPIVFLPLQVKHRAILDRAGSVSLSSCKLSAVYDALLYPTKHSATSPKGPWLGACPGSQSPSLSRCFNTASQMFLGVCIWTNEQTDQNSTLEAMGIPVCKARRD